MKSCTLREPNSWTTWKPNAVECELMVGGRNYLVFIAEVKCNTPQIVKDHKLIK